MPNTLHLQVNTSLNLYMSRPSNELDFMVPWSEDLNQYIKSLTEKVDHILLGRKLAEGFIPHWRSNPSHEDQSTIDTFNNMRKTIFTRTLTESPWDETTQLAKRGLAEEVRRLKAEDGGGKDLIVYGGCTFVQALIEAELIDEFHLLVHPVHLKEGRAVFVSEGKLELVETRAFDCGVVLMHYRKAN